MSYNADLQANNVDLQGILDTANALPEAGGMVLETCVVNIAVSTPGAVFCYTTVENGVKTAKIVSVAENENLDCDVLKNSAVLLYAPDNRSDYYAAPVTKIGRSDDWNTMLYWVTEGEGGYIWCS